MTTKGQTYDGKVAQLPVDLPRHWCDQKWLIPTAANRWRTYGAAASCYLLCWWVRTPLSDLQTRRTTKSCKR